MTNFIVVMADDQAMSQMPFMPFTRDMNRQGRVFSGMRLDAALCQPSRSSLFTGLLAKNHGCYNNGEGDLAGIDLDNSLAKWLDDAGYRTGLIGKYMNALLGNVTPPAGWDTWRKFQNAVAPAQGFGVWDGTSQTFLTTHQLDYILSEFTTFIVGSEPWFVYLAPLAPHVPYSPKVNDLFKYRHHMLDIPNEVDVSDKPAWIQAFSQLTTAEKRLLRNEYRMSIRENAGLDALVRVVYEAMDPSDTVLFYTSDNGFHFGEHNRRESSGDPNPKYDCYDPSINMPLIAYGQGFTPGTTTQPVQMQDITATIVEMSGATAPYALDGVDLRDVQNNPSTYNTRKLLHQVRSTRCPDADAITITEDGAVATRKLIRYYGDVKATLLPNGNVSSSNVTVTGAATVYEALDDTSEAEYVIGTSATAAEFIVELEDGTDPDYATSTEHVVTFHGQRGSSVDVSLTVELREGTTVIATWSETLTVTATTFTETLTAAQAAAITDYTALRLRFVQNSLNNVRMVIYYASLAVPTRTFEAYDLDTDPDELVNWAGDGGRLTERNALESDLDALL